MAFQHLRPSDYLAMPWKDGGGVTEQIAIEPPECYCGGLVRPNVVWFGENLPSDAWNNSVAAVSTADLVITVGTSSIVYPAASLPEAAARSGIPVIEVNPKPTPFSEQATLCIRANAADVLPTLLQKLPELLPNVRPA